MLLWLEVAELYGLLDDALGDALRAHLGALNHAAVLGGADLPRDLKIIIFQYPIFGMNLEVFYLSSSFQIDHVGC